jgi:hypothetical protein
MHGVKKLALKKLEREILIFFIGSPLVAAAFSSFGTRPNGLCAAHDGGGSDPTGSVTHGASKGGVAPASSEFGRVLPGFLFKGYLCCSLQVRVTAQVKRIKAMGEAPR